MSSSRSGVRADRDATRRSYDRLSAAYDLIADSSEHEARDAGLAALAIEPGERVLEIGSGTGHALVDLAQRVGSGGSVVGVDLSPGMLEVARRRLETAGLAHRVTLDLEDARSLPYDDSCFEAVFSSFTLELFEDEDVPRVLDEVRRLLKQKGRVGIVSLAETDEPHIASTLYKWFHRHFPHFVDCRPIDLHGILQRSRFSVTRRARLSIWGLPVDVVVASPRMAGSRS